MIAMELLDAMDRVEELASLMNYNMLDYLSTQLTWLLDYCEKKSISLPDLDKAMLFLKKLGPTVIPWNTYGLLLTAHPTQDYT